MSSQQLPRRVTSYVAITFGWTWGLLGAAWLSGADAGEAPTTWLRLVAGLGPVVAAGALLLITSDSDDRRWFWHRVVDARGVGPGWWGVISIVAAGPAIAVWLAGDRRLGIEEPSAILVMIGFAVAAGLVEEPGWRGYMLDGLRRRPLAASALISVVWAAWHLPLFTIVGTFQHDEGGLGTSMFWIFMSALVPQTILMIWIVEHSGRSILPAVVFHALTNISGELLDLSMSQQFGRLAIWAALATPIVILWLRKLRARDPSTTDRADDPILSIRQ